jgi:hypothetical protein
MRIIQVLALAALPAAAVLTGCGSHANENSVLPSYAMGERAPAGHLIYTVFETKWMPQLGEGVGARVPSNRFFLVRISVVNSGSGESAVPPVTLVGDNGERLPELSDGDGVPQWAGYLRRVKATDTLSGNVVFDVPPRHYKLEVTDEGQDRKALIDIPLAFSEAPVVEIPVPEMPAPGPTKPK